MKTIKDCSNCSCQETDLTTAYTYACVVFALVGVPVGAIFDKFGTMTTRLIGASLFLFGNILVLSAQNNHRSVIRVKFQVKYLLDWPWNHKMYHDFLVCFILPFVWLHAVGYFSWPVSNKLEIYLLKQGEKLSQW